MTTFFIFFAAAIFDLSEGNYRFLSAVSGRVERENFDYYTTDYEGTILLELTSLSGDSDLYVSQKTIKPTYDPDNNCLQSVTCGLDKIIIPKSFKRPIGIGVYGHPSHEISQYVLTIGGIDCHQQDLIHCDPSMESLQSENKKFETPLSEDNGQEETMKESNGNESSYWILLKSLFSLFDNGHENPIIEILLALT